MSRVDHRVESWGLTIEDPLGAGPSKCPVQAGIVGSDPFEVPFGVLFDRQG